MEQMRKNYIHIGISKEQQKINNLRTTYIRNIEPARNKQKELRESYMH